MTEEKAPHRTTSRLAIASLILGPLTGIPGFILGIRAIREINASRGALGGKGLAIAGVVTSAVTTLMIAAGLFLPALARAREQSRRAHCLSNLKRIGLALHMYAADNNEGFPNDGGGYSTRKAPGEQPEVSGATVLGLLCDKKYYVVHPQVFSCPTTPATAMWSTPVDDSMVSYGYDQRHTSIHPADVAVVSDEPPLAPEGNSENHFGDGQNMLFIDGHVKWFISINVGHSDGNARDDIFRDDEYPDARWDSWIVR